MLLKYIGFALFSAAINYGVFRLCYDNSLFVGIWQNEYILTIVEKIMTFSPIHIENIVDTLSFWSSYALGLFVGFVIKYLLDKKYVFNDGYENRKAETKKAGLYAFMSILCTILSVGITGSFKIVVGVQFAKRIGWFLGLLFGYTAKFFLDKKYVFKVS